MKKQSRFQQRLEEIQKTVNEETGDSKSGKVKLHKTEEATEDGSTTKTAQPPQLPGFRTKSWKHVDVIPPPYYRNVHVWDGEKVYYNWARVWSETAGDIFVKNDSDEVKTNIIQWVEPEDVPQYTDNIPDDCKILSVNDVKELIRKMEDLYQYIGEAGSHYGCGFNNAVKQCITLLEEQLHRET